MEQFKVSAELIWNQSLFLLSYPNMGIYMNSIYWKNTGKIKRPNSLSSKESNLIESVNYDVKKLRILQFL